MNNDIALIKVENYKFSEILSSFYTDDHWYKYHSTCFISVSGSDVEQAFLVGSVSSLTASGFTAYGEYGNGILASIASSIPGQVTFSALAGGLTALACEGDFIEGAAQSTLTYLANHLYLHQNSLPARVVSAERIYSIPMAITINPIIRDKALMPEAPSALTITAELRRIK